MPLKYYQPQFYGVQHQQFIQVPWVGLYGHHVYQPHVYGLPALHHLGKREAKAELNVAQKQAQCMLQCMFTYNTDPSVVRN